MTVPARNAHRYLLAIDFGTTYTAAALCTGGTVGMLEIHGSSRTSSAVFADDGGLLLGKVAEQRAAGAPERFERSPKHYLEEGETGLVLAASAWTSPRMRPTTSRRRRGSRTAWPLMRCD